MNKKMIIFAVLMVFALGLLLFSVRMAGKSVKSKTTQVTKETATEAETEATTETATEKRAEQTPGPSLKTAQVSEADFWGETAILLEKSRLTGMPAYYHTIKRDPMQPALASAKASPFKLMLKGEMASASLTGVLVGKGRTGAVAIINEKIYRVGDIVDDKKIIAIERNRVILKRGMDEEILRLETN